MNDAWLNRIAPRKWASARLFCFAYAGGGPSIFRLWPAGLPHQLDVCAVQLPGRQNRLNEPPIASIPKIVEALTVAMSPFLDMPYALFGHSMGAVLAWEVARTLVLRGGQEPTYLFVSGRRAPHIEDTAPPLHKLTDDDFVRELNRRYGGIPTELLRDRDVLGLLLPGLRSDIAALETFTPASRPPLRCPISAFGGSHDPQTPHAYLEAWRKETSNAFRVRIFPGDHFFLDQRRPEVLAELTANLLPVLGAAMEWRSA